MFYERVFRSGEDSRLRIPVRQFSKILKFIENYNFYIYSSALSRNCKSKDYYNCTFPLCTVDNPISFQLVPIVPSSTTLQSHGHDLDVPMGTILDVPFNQLLGTPFRILPSRLRL
ncbi:unnamed protein product [Gordionus sp. m RMFG-2023]